VKKTLLAIILIISLTYLWSEVSLESAINMARENNKELKMSKEDVSIADYNYKEIKGQLLPQINLNASYSLKKNWLPDSAIPPSKSFVDDLDATADANDTALADGLNMIYGAMIPEDESEEASLVGQIQMQQILFSGGKLINGIRVLDKIKTLQSKKYQLAEQQLVIDVIDAYYNLYLARKVNDIQVQALETAELHLERVQNSFNQGLVSEYDRLRAELEVSRLYPQVLESENQKNLAEENLRRVIGYNSEEELILSDDITYNKAFNISIDNALNLANKQRIELYLTEVMKEIYQVQYKAEKGNYLPNIALTADVSKYNSSDSFSVDKDDFGTMASVGLGFQMPLFTGFSNTSKTLRAKHELRKSEYDAINTQDLINLEIRQIWQSYQHSMKNLETQKKNLILAERAFEIAESRFQNQTGIQLEVFDAQIQLNSAKIALAQADIQVLKNYYALNKSIGNNLYNLIGEEK
jgi:outer membrane protein TolC